AGICGAKSESYTAKIAAEATLSNRLFGAFGFMGIRQKCRVDARMYHQQHMAKHYYENDRAFTPDGINGKITRGPQGLLKGLSAGVSAIFTGFAYLFTCLKAIGGAFGVGAVTQYVGAVTTLSSNISELFAVSGALRSNARFVNIAYQYLDIPNSMYQGSLTTEKRADRQYEVEFKDVSFQYPGTDTWALRHVNMKFRVGKRLAVVGENGSGKTTFIKLLCRLYDPTEGQILLNGIDIRKYDYRDYMNIFSVVFQDFQLIAQPLGANVAGAATYDRDRVEKALVDAGFGDRLKEMPKGLDTYLYKELDKEGVEVSGGEAQKIAIARALYKDAPFIILDEPTAALDPLAEAEIYSKFDQIAGDRTAVYISHRLSSCKFCDEIAVFDHGAVAQQGSHESLLADQNGKYHELWNAQAQYYAQEAESAEV
ncbi:MAG: ABC transporter ATP-binding protein/permease, partial [Oscillospiraceae bacterium]|nr:ABC transporter ATP-binding protein/permease [Oscillospiraceae bacterium]